MKRLPTTSSAKLPQSGSDPRTASMRRGMMPCSAAMRARPVSSSEKLPRVIAAKRAQSSASLACPPPVLPPATSDSACPWRKSSPMVVVRAPASIRTSEETACGSCMRSLRPWGSQEMMAMARAASCAADALSGACTLWTRKEMERGKCADAICAMWSSARISAHVAEDAWPDSSDILYSADTAAGRAMAQRRCTACSTGDAAAGGGDRGTAEACLITSASRTCARLWTSRKTCLGTNSDMSTAPPPELGCPAPTSSRAILVFARRSWASRVVTCASAASAPPSAERCALAWAIARSWRSPSKRRCISSAISARSWRSASRRRCMSSAWSETVSFCS
mmetsp:Transcript_71891/g.164742  ORF Transcript_71891/g.164742 Transcript_71891/m.164742 type:complete len:337 (-) Transcript_71891:925-1935(-)